MNGKMSRQRRSASESSSRRRRKQHDEPEKKEEAQIPYKYTLDFGEKEKREHRRHRGEVSKVENYENSRVYSSQKQVITRDLPKEAIALNAFSIEQPSLPPPNFETHRSFHQRPPTLDITVPIESLPTPSHHRTASFTQGKRQDFEIPKVSVQPQHESTKRTRTRTRKHEAIEQETTQKAAKDIEKPQQLEKPPLNEIKIQKNERLRNKRNVEEIEQKPYYYPKPYHDILSEKPVFQAMAAAKPLIGTENDRSVTPVAVKALTPTMKEQRNCFEFDNKPDDYRGRRIGYSPYETQYNTIQPSDKREKKKIDVNPESENDMLLGFSGKHRSLSSNSRPKSKANITDLKKAWVPPALANNENMSIDGVVIKPLLNHLNESSSSSSSLNTSTGSEILNCQDEIPVDISELKKAKPKQDEKKPSYQPPELKKFEGQHISKFAQFPVSPEVPKATIKRNIDCTSPTSSKQVAEPAVESPPTRTRRRRPQ